MTENLLKPTPKNTLRGHEVTEQIKNFILRNGLTSGDPLPTESELCSELGASRSSVREAIKRLSALDIVEVRHGHGTYVGRLSLNALVESLTFRGRLSSGDDLATLSELVTVRKVLEQGMGEAIIQAYDDEQHSALEALVLRMEEAAERGESFIEEDRSFHLMLLAPMNNHLVTQLTGAFWDVQAVVAPLLLTTEAEARETAAAHRAIIESARHGDLPAFVAAVAEHYAPILNHLQEPEGNRG
ncbi:FadR/GntR family transcriptional regulator [Nocardiopsis alkaliphila]|uniref:FadR/GntR family transcriptional regulator n=1 Tax=Nocardiopsis alkaliphila TaxID=225762 RepID=UPI0003463B5A|nr:GntR family transcriptional regulator [Nocardiopsis alkaliphila]